MLVAFRGRRYINFVCDPMEDTYVMHLFVRQRVFVSLVADAEEERGVRGRT